MMRTAIVTTATEQLQFAPRRLQLRGGLREAAHRVLRHLRVWVVDPIPFGCDHRAELIVDAQGQTLTKRVRGYRYRHARSRVSLEQTADRVDVGLGLHDPGIA